jgi:hypothetical protein
MTKRTSSDVEWVILYLRKQGMHMRDISMFFHESLKLEVSESRCLSVIRRLAPKLLKVNTPHIRRPPPVESSGICEGKMYKDYIKALPKTRKGKRPKPTKTTARLAEIKRGEPLKEAEL